MGKDHPSELDPDEVIRILKKAGATFLKQGKGDHEVWYRCCNGARYVTQVDMGRPVPEGTLMAIARQMGISKKDFWGLYHGTVTVPFDPIAVSGK